MLSLCYLPQLTCFLWANPSFCFKRNQSNINCYIAGQIYPLLKLAVRFLDLPAEELSDLAELKLKVVESILEAAAGGDNDTLLKYLKEELLADVPLDAAEEEKLAQLSEDLVRKKK